MLEVPRKLIEGTAVPRLALLRQENIRHTSATLEIIAGLLWWPCEGTDSETRRFRAKLP
jgi:hypothetical protein